MVRIIKYHYARVLALLLLMVMLVLAHHIDTAKADPFASEKSKAEEIYGEEIVQFVLDRSGERWHWEALNCLLNVPDNAWRIKKTSLEGLT